MSQNFLPDDIDGGPVIPAASLKAICSYLEWNPETRYLRFAAPKTKLEVYPDYNSHETASAKLIADSVRHEFPVGTNPAEESEDSQDEEESNISDQSEDGFSSDGSSGQEESAEATKIVPKAGFKIREAERCGALRTF